MIARMLSFRKPAFGLFGKGAGMNGSTLAAREKELPIIGLIRSGLLREGQKELPSKYLYDDVGSALFEVITLLPEYGLTRAGERLLGRYSKEIVQRLSPAIMVVELGSGTGRKTRRLLEELGRRRDTIYHPIEISPSALAQCRRELGHIRGISVLGFENEYLEGLEAAAGRRPSGESLLVLFLGSTIGNFEPDKAIGFLAGIRSKLIPGDALLLAADLVKPVPQLLLAYDDPIGVTAAFNLNLLARLNRELGADFVIGNFRHEAVWNASESRIEMHLRSLVRQNVKIPGANLEISFETGETIWTESSHKFTAAEVERMAGRTGFRCDHQWVDDQWPFAQSLFFAV